MGERSVSVTRRIHVIGQRPFLPSTFLGEQYAIRYSRSVVSPDASCHENSRAKIVAAWSEAKAGQVLHLHFEEQRHNGSHY
jgi:hypothetical protein